MTITVKHHFKKGWQWFTLPAIRDYGSFIVIRMIICSMRIERSDNG